MCWTWTFCRRDGISQGRRVAEMGGLGDAAGAADVNTIVPVSEVATGLRRPLGPGGFMELSQAELSQAAGVNHVSACGFTSGLPVATGRKCLHRPVTSERALRAGPVADVPYICNNGRGGAVDGRQPFLPVGATAVNSGLQRGRGHSRSGAVAASLSCFSCSAVWELAAARAWGSSGMLRPSAGHLVNAVVNAVRCPSAVFSGAFQLRHARGPRSLLDGPGVSP